MSCLEGSSNRLAINLSPRRLHHISRVYLTLQVVLTHKEKYYIIYDIYNYIYIHARQTKNIQTLNYFSSNPIAFSGISHGSLGFLASVPAKSGKVVFLRLSSGKPIAPAHCHVLRCVVGLSLSGLFR